MDSSTPGGPIRSWISRWFWLLAGVLALALLYWSEHRDHVLGLLPYLIVLACPLMHFFMHGGRHGRHHRHGRTENSDPK